MLKTRLVLGAALMGALGVACGNSGLSSDGGVDAPRDASGAAGGAGARADGGADVATVVIGDAAGGSGGAMGGTGGGSVDGGAGTRDAAAEAAASSIDAAVGEAGALDASVDVDDGGADAGGADGPCTGAPTVRLDAWTIATSVAGPSISCAQAGAASVQLLMNATRFAFSCDAGTGTSSELTAGMYTPRVALVSQYGTVLAQGALPSVTLPSCGPTSLGILRFVVIP